jgi:hypothetical protein
LKLKSPPFLPKSDSQQHRNHPPLRPNLSIIASYSKCCKKIPTSENGLANASSASESDLNSNCFYFILTGYCKREKIIEPLPNPRSFIRTITFFFVKKIYLFIITDKKL